MAGRRQASIGFWLAVAAVATMAGWRIVIVAGERPAHLQAIAAEFAAVHKFLLSPPVANNAGNKVLFFQGTEQGVGLFLFDTASGQKRLVHEQSRKNFDPGRLRILDWAPDGSRFAYQQHYPQEHLYSEIVVCDGKSGDVITSQTVQQQMSGFAWLSPQRFAYVTIKDGKRDLNIMEESDGKWNPQKPFRDFAKRTSLLTGISADSLVWQEGNTLRLLDLQSRKSRQIWKSATKTLERFSYSRDTERFELLCADASGERFYDFSPPAAGSGQTVDDSETQLLNISSEPNFVARAFSINNGEGAAYTIQDLGQRTLFVRANASAAPVSLFARGGVVDFTVSGKQMFVIGALTNEPPALWQYDLAAKSLNCVYSSQERPFRYAKYVVPSCETATNADGREFTYHLWQPLRASGHKAPLIIGCSQYNWQVYPEVAANGGAFYVNVDRPQGWDMRALADWSESIMAVYNKLARDPRIDTGAVFLYGTSAETGILPSLVADHSDLWKGLILFDPVSFPDLASVEDSKILMDDGLDDETVKPILNYQDTATKAGVPVLVAMHKDEGHIFWSAATEREKAQRFAKFVFGY